MMIIYIKGVELLNIKVMYFIKEIDIKHILKIKYFIDIFHSNFEDKLLIVRFFLTESFDNIKILRN